jgi:Protein of unknown function (DUF3224)
MTAHAAGTFTVKSWDESTYQELGGGAKLTKATASFDFGGDLKAEGHWDAVMCYRNDGTAVYTGYQQMAGQVGDREGSFVMRADGEFAASEARSEWLVVEGSGTGALGTLRGTGSAVAGSGTEGTYRFDYDLDPA